MELDHIFVFANPNGIWPAQLSKIGLVETYRRRHPGQGTSNACYCFDNAFLEVIWVEDIDETQAESIRRCRFDARSKWLTNSGVNPFGIAWRGVADVETWAFRPPYLPQDKAILVAKESDDLGQPFMFSFPGTMAPSTWQPERRGALQSVAGFTKLTVENITLANGLAASHTLQLLNQLGCVEDVAIGSEHLAVLRLESHQNELSCRIALPHFDLL